MTSKDPSLRGRSTFQQGGRSNPGSDSGSPQAGAAGLRDDGKKAAPRRQRKRTLQQQARLVARNMRP